MAGPSRLSSLYQLTKECNVCFIEYDNAKRLPKILHCGHDICVSCLLDLFKKDGLIRCPVCRKEFEQNPENGAAYITAFAMIPGDTEDSLSSNTPAVCQYENCVSTEDVEICKHCDRYLCKVHYQIDRKNLFTDAAPLIAHCKLLKMSWENIETEVKAISELEFRRDKLSKMIYSLETLKMGFISDLEEAKCVKQERLEVSKRLGNDIVSLEMALRDGAQSNVIYGLSKRNKLSYNECKELPKVIEVPPELQNQMIDGSFHRILDEFERKQGENVLNYCLFDTWENVLTFDNKNEGVWMIKRASEKVMGEECIKSPFWYCGLQGYKIQMELDVQQQDSPHFVGIYIRICHDNHTHQLQWPFIHTLEVLLWNHCNTEESLEHVFSIDKCMNHFTNHFQEPLNKDNSALGNPKFITKANLLSTDHLVNDTITFKIKLYPSKESSNRIPKPILSHSKPNFFYNETPVNTKSWPWSSKNSIIWKISHPYSKIKEKLFSPVFSIRKYSFMLEMYLNGNGENNLGFVSLYVYLVKGEHDDKLDWPCPLKFRMEILDISDVNGTSSIYFDFADSTVNVMSRRTFDKPTADLNVPFGKERLVMTEKVFKLEKHRYLENDNMYIRFSVM